MKPHRIELVLDSGLTVEGDYHAGHRGSDVEPPEGECFEAERLYIGNRDATEMLTEYVDWKRIEADALQAINEMRGAA